MICWGTASAISKKMHSLDWAHQPTPEKHFILIGPLGINVILAEEGLWLCKPSLKMCFLVFFLLCFLCFLFLPLSFHNFIHTDLLQGRDWFPVLILQRNEGNTEKVSTDATITCKIVGTMNKIETSSLWYFWTNLPPSPPPYSMLTVLCQQGCLAVGQQLNSWKLEIAQWLHCVCLSL